MRKSKFLFITIFIVMILAISVVVFASCKRTDEPVPVDTEGSINVSTAMGKVYGAILAADTSASSNNIYLSIEGKYKEGGAEYDLRLVGSFDITQDNVENDTKSALALEVKKDATQEVLALYYQNGHFYIDASPYVRRSILSDVSLAEIVAELHREKRGGVIKNVSDLIPEIASNVFDGCRFESDLETGEVTYIFSLSYERLFSSLADLVEKANIGITSTELLSALHITDAAIASLAEEEGATVSFLLKDGAFVSATATSDAKRLSLTSFALTNEAKSVEISSAIAQFTDEFDYRNFTLSGTADLAFSHEEGDEEFRHGVRVNRDIAQLTYSFDYELVTHYEPGVGQAGSLSLRDKNGKESSFVLKAGYLYVDLSAYGIARFKISTTELARRLTVAGLTNTEGYTFSDKVRLLAHIAAAKTREGDTITYALDETVFSLLARELGFEGVFGVRGATISWSVANERLSDLAVSVEFPDATLSLADRNFTFGTRHDVELPENADEYADLGERTSTKISFSGTITENTFYSSTGAMLSSLLSSLSGESLSFDATGEISYIADVLFDEKGATDKALIQLFKGDEEITKIYYTAETADVFYLIDPLPLTDVVRPVRVYSFAEEPFAAFNEANELTRAEAAKRLFLSAAESSFTFGWNAGFGSEILSRFTEIFPGLSLKWHDEMAFSRMEVTAYADHYAAMILLDKNNDVYVTATSFSVSFNEGFGIESAVLKDAPTTVSLYADNDMPTYATVTFKGDTTAYKLSLLDEKGESLWRYANTPTRVGAVGEQTTVTATVCLLGSTITHELTVDMTPPADTILGGAAQDSSVPYYSSSARRFTFSLYGTARPKEVLRDYNKITLDMGGGVKYEGKEITSWDDSAVTTNAEDRSNFAVKPKVRSYFGDEIEIGDRTQPFTLAIVGAKADHTNYTETFVAYDGRDPMDARSYNAEIQVYTTKDETDAPITVPVTWETNAATKVKNRRYAESGSTLYSFSGTDTVKAVLTDCMGSEQRLDVTISFVTKVIPNDYSRIAFDTSGLDGVEYDATTHTFKIDSLKVRALSSTAWENILPSSVTIKRDDGSTFGMSGITWDFQSVDSVDIARGASDTMDLLVGDNVSGVQTRTFNYSFTPIAVSGIELAETADGAAFSTSAKGDKLYTHTISGATVYDYKYPTYVRVKYQVGSGSTATEETDVLTPKWSFTPDFDTTAIANGGTFTGTCYLGNQTLTVTYTFTKALLDHYSFRTITEDGVATNRIVIDPYRVGDKDILGGEILFDELYDETRLIFSSANAIKGKLRYFDAASYPKTILVYLKNADGTVSNTPAEVPVTWDLSAFKDLDTVVENSYVGTVRAIARGQSISVAVYVAPAIGTLDKLYTDGSTTEASTLNYHILEADAETGYTVLDPRKASSYPTVLYVSRQGSSEREPISVLRWDKDDLSAIAKYFEKQKDTPANLIEHNFSVKAYFGDDAIGTTSRTITVRILQSKIENIKVDGIPSAVSAEYAADSDFNAVKPIYESGTHGPFTYALQLEMNPYYVKPTDPVSYPRYLRFELNEVATIVTPRWDLSEPGLETAVNKGNVKKYDGYEGSYGYPVYALIDVAEGLSPVKVGVEVSIKEKTIDKVWINGSDQRYFYVDGYTAEPFGSQVVGGKVYMSVQVQFSGDTHKYPLKMYYFNSGVNLSYEGTGGKKDIKIYVGNDNVEYVAIEGYEVRVTKNVVSKIEIPGETPTLFYSLEEIPDGSLEETFNKVSNAKLDTDTLLVTYGGVKHTVYRYNHENAATAGVVFEWKRNGEGSLGIRLYNPQPALREICGPDQELYNREQQNDQAELTDVSVIFDTDVEYSLSYGDTTSDMVTPARVLSRFAKAFKVDQVDSEYQTRYMTTAEDEKEVLDDDAILSVGTYKLWVKVDHHSRYKGEISVDFTVTPKDISEYVTLLLNTAAYTAGTEVVYSPEEYANALTASTGDYHVGVSLLVEGKKMYVLRDVAYDTDGEVTVTVVHVSSDNANYTVGEDNDKSFSIKYVEKLTKSGDFSATVQWNGTGFDVKVRDNINGRDLAPDTDEKLTNGYKISYYNEGETTEVDAEELIEGNSYDYYIEIKIPNYKGYDIKSPKSVPAA